jgi:LysM repeat protein
MRKVTLVITIFILGLSVSVASAAPPGQDSGGEVYTVQKDDWLSKIAEKYYGDMFAYPVIVEATNAKAAEDASFAVINNPDLIEIGQKLWIPDATGAAQAAPPATGTAASTGGNLTLEALRNATYQGIYNEPVQLTGGKYEGKPFVEGGASRPTVTFVDPFNALGDLNGDGLEDAAVVLAENSGGSGVFLYLEAVVDQNGTPANVATQLLGDRVEIKSIAIDGGEIVIDMVTQGPNDPFCCPSMEATLMYRLEGDRLVEQTAFAGTYKAMLPAASSPGRDITLNLKPDGSVELSTDYLNGEAPIVEIGTWQDDNDGTATVTLTGRPGGQIYDTPNAITFRLVKGELIGIVYDINLYGSEGLRLTRQ